ncbi:dimethyl sulfoxide reductase anchor subunit family protein [Siccibacter colletis]|uniref:Dimethyl sulfoxide reductase anchor subunit n=1 Tax=Siccibacter colletis TaxID=1505757 RepID=A0ABY6JC58_9ENTR|nr:DmsC/YnfH family molybdoenzyme membrane anchor subunit [Siccibacter colletis]UYU31415.1 dimethyl sulfoxide reductase anchor subunit [Siccibacter colletis]
MHEIPLLMFTLLMQMSVGLTLFISLALLLLSGEETAKTTRLMIVPLLVGCVSAGVGLICSMLHLGYPLNALNALRHFASSWLSREIIFAGAYLAMLGAATLLALLKHVLWRWLMPFALALGLIDIFCMSAIYAHSGVMTWTHYTTWLLFFGSVGVTGAVAQSWLVAHPQEQAVRSTLLWSGAITALVALAVRALFQPFYLEYLAQMSLSDVVTFPHQPLRAWCALAAVRTLAWLLAFVGAALLVINARYQKRVTLICAAVALVLSEVLFRYVFFSIG